MNRIQALLSAVAFSIAAGFAVGGPVPANKPAHYPEWWFERDVIPRTSATTSPQWPTDYPHADDFSVANQGQAKHLVEQVAEAVRTKIPYGLGHVLEEHVGNVLYPAEGLRGEYYLGTNLAGLPVLTRNEGIDFNWGSGAPGSGVSADLFSVRWTGKLIPTHTGYHTISTHTDDGVRVWLDGQLIINNWTDHGATTDIAMPVSLVAGKAYELKLEYYERGGGSLVRLMWQAPGSAAASPIPAANLRSATAGSDDYRAINIGQLKFISAPFYGYLGLALPWTGSPQPPDDFAVANIGQLKRLFSFDLNAPPGSLPVWWQLHYFGRVDVDPEADGDFDGVSNLQEYQAGSIPTNYYSRPGGNLNLPPSLAVQGEQTLVWPANQLSLQAQAGDPDNGPQPLSYTWSKVSGPGNVSFSGTDQAQTTAEFSQVGAYVLKIEVSDGQATSAAIVAVNVLSSAAATPTVLFTAPLDGTQMTQGQKFILWVKASDDSSNIATVALYRNGLLLETLDGGSITSYLFNRTESALGAVTFTAVATNTLGISASASIVVSFFPANVGPPPGGGGPGGGPPGNPGPPGSTTPVPGAFNQLTLPANGPLGLPVQFAVTTSDRDEVSEEQEYTGVPGQFALLEVVVYSEEYPNYTGQQSIYDDAVSWTVQPLWGASISGTHRVNELHDKFNSAGEAIVGLFAVRFPSTGEPKLKFNSTVQNIADGALDTNTQFRLLTIDISEVSFGGTKYWELWADDCGVADAGQVPAEKKYSAPQWKDVDGDGKPTNIAQGERDYAVAFTRNTNPKISAKFKITNASNLGTIKIKATGPGGVAIPETTATVSDDDVTLPETETSSTLVNTIKFYDKKDEAKAFKLEWELKIGSADWMKIGATKHTVYVTLNDPTLNLRQETLFDLACRNADGIAAKSDAVAAIWSDFRPDSDGVPRLLRVSSSSPMTYYRNSQYPYLTQAAGLIPLLSSGDGRCGAFQHLFIALLEVHAIDSVPLGVEPSMPAGPAGAIAAFRIKFGVDPVPPSNGWAISEIFYVKRWDLSVDRRWEGVDIPGVAGQGNANPIAVFGDHALVEYGGQIYDPSYGAGPFSSILEWEDASVDGFGVQFYPSASAAAADFRLWTEGADQKGVQEVHVQ